MNATSMPDGAQVCHEEPANKAFSMESKIATKTEGWSSLFPDFDIECDYVGFEEYLAPLPWDNDSRNHNKAYDAFLRGASLGIPPQDAIDAVEKRIRTAGGIVDPADLCEQQRRAYEYVGNSNSSEITTPQKCASVAFSPEKLAAAASRVSIPDPTEFIRQRSIFAPATITAEDFLNHLYEKGEHIVVFTEQKSQGQAVFSVGHSSGEKLPQSGPSGVLYLIQPIDGRWHKMPEGKFSRRSKESVLRWPYLLLESDEADSSQWNRLLIQLPLKIVAIYTSGRRSVHAIVRIDAASKEDWDSFKINLAKIMVPLVADTKALTAVRLSRLPQCRRGESLQELLYLNPEADGTPILNLPPRIDDTMQEGRAYG